MCNDLRLGAHTWMASHAGPIVSPIDGEAATDNRDSLAKTLYSRMFDWLVDKINTSIGQDPNAVSMVGVLDIYGEACLRPHSHLWTCALLRKAFPVSCGNNAYMCVDRQFACLPSSFWTFAVANLLTVQSEQARPWPCKTSSASVCSMAKHGRSCGAQSLLGLRREATA